ncbi:MAG: hypothetical protein M1826_007403 [Phylliscum demangeonii]|nr:MAG: hypothetical protein M1826_007403 [Phylliscum demangeonii]
MAGAGQRRITKELAEVTASPPTGITVTLLDESDVYKWAIVMKGPPDSPYAGGRFKLQLVLPADYPFKPPALNFQTKIYHPNVANEKGSMCLGMLKGDEWKPSSKILAVLETARNLLVEPNPDDAVETAIAEQYKKDRKAFERSAKEWVKKYAKPEAE